MTPIHGIICYWTAGKDKRDKNTWDFVESYPIDMDGHCIVAPKSTGGGSRHEYNKWLSDENNNDIDGRAVTLWTFYDGVQLMGLNLPEYSKWLSPLLYEEIAKNRKWLGFIEGGYKMLEMTVREAHKYFPQKDD